MTALRLVATIAAATRLLRAIGARPAVRPTVTPRVGITVVVPARDEEHRIGPLLDAVVGARGVREVIVVDDESTDATARVAATAGATVLAGAPAPDGWAGKAWALEQGARAATTDWIVTLDADTRPAPTLPTAVVARGIGDDLDLVTVAGRFECPTPGSRWLHPSLLTTLVYRFGPPGAVGAQLANGQCMAFDRRRLAGFGGFESVAGHVVEDVALARHVAAQGGRVAFLDGGDILTVRMFESFGDTLRGWGRSIALPGVESPPRQLAGLGVVALAQALPLLRLVTRRADALDLVLLALRGGTLVGTRRAYTTTGPEYWASPLADTVSVGALAVGIARRRRQTWRGRAYG